MALPPHFKGSAQYFEESLKFFYKYEHLFNFPNTDVLINNTFDHIDIELENVDVFNESFEIFALKSKYLQDFFDNYEKFKPIMEQFRDKELDFLIDAPLSWKKKHEISYLAKEIGALCEKVECDTVVDFGSGLGYLDQQLYETTNLNVVGLESNENNYIGAKKRQRKYHLNSIQRVKYIKHKITEHSKTNIEQYLEDKFPNYAYFCITGLHACADLTVDAIDLFLKMDKAKAIIIMPCCYHRLMRENNTFKNFPLSNTLRNAYETTQSDFLNVPFLRLATQPPNLREEKLENMVFNLLARAVIQVYAKKHNCRVKRNKRKAVRLKTMENNFDDYIEDAKLGFTLINNSYDDNLVNEKKEPLFYTEELIGIWRQVSELTRKKAAVFILLQNYLQPVFENFVLFDRIVYLQEKGVNNCKFNKIVNANISPRNLALLAQK